MSEYLKFYSYVIGEFHEPYRVFASRKLCFFRLLISVVVIWLLRCVNSIKEYALIQLKKIFRNE